MSIDRKPALGDKARDRVTGFEGTITGHARYLTGCDQVSITPTVDSDGRIRSSEWFDIDRVEPTSERRAGIV